MLTKVEGSQNYSTLKTGLTGFEPATSAVTGRCSNQLNYRPLQAISILLRNGHFVKQLTQVFPETEIIQPRRPVSTGVWQSLLANVSPRR